MSKQSFSAISVASCEFLCVPANSPIQAYPGRILDPSFGQNQAVRRKGLLQCSKDSVECSVSGAVGGNGARVVQEEAKAFPDQFVVTS